MYRVILPVLFLLSSLLLATIGHHPVSAQQKSGISISPLRQEGVIDPGFIYSGKLQIKNTGTQPQQIDLSAETFNVTNQSYDYLFKTETTESRWVTFNRYSLLLKAGEETSITYEVSVPIDAEPAGYYLALFALNRPPSSEDGGIIPSERVASLLYLTVSGDTVRTGKLVQLRSPFIVFGESNWSATLQNSGTLHYRSVYSSKISSIFGNEIKSHEDSRLILPSTVRLIEGSMQLPDILGIYKVTYSVSLGDTPGHSETRWFLYLPPLQLILITLIIVGIFLIVRRRKRN